MTLLDGRWSWLALGSGLFLATFGSHGFLIILCVLCFFAGALIITFYYGREQSQNILQVTPELPTCSPGIQQVKDSMESTTKIKNFDKRITGSSAMDEVLQEVIQYTIRDYIKNWYRVISDHDGFQMDIRQCVQTVCVTFSSRTKEIDWMPYFTQRLVDDFASHIRLYRHAAQKITKKEDKDRLVEQAFFDLEMNMEGDKCRDSVCFLPEYEKQYLQDLSEVLLFLLLPTEDFQNKPFRYIIREVLVHGVFLPTIELLSDPDYINQYIVWLCKTGSFTNETFMTVIKTTSSIDELKAVTDMVDCDIAKWRSMDTGGSDDMLIKQNLNSLIFLKELCENRIRRLQQGIDDTEFAPDVPDYCKAKDSFILTLEDIIQSNIALDAFIEFMSSVGGQMYLFFYLNVEGFRVAAEQQINLEPLRNAAQIIYDQYLSEKASSKIKIEADILKRFQEKIRRKDLVADVFDEVQARVYQIMHGEQYYVKFIQSKAYSKLLEDLGFSRSYDGDSISLDDDVPMKPSEINDDSISINSSEEGSVASFINSSASLNSSAVHGEVTVSATVSQTGVIHESEKTGKSYAIFYIRVTKRMGQDDEIWDVYRRYSDFHDLNMILTEKFPDFDHPSLPSKTVRKNINEEFLNKRRKALDQYLQSLLNPEVWEHHPGMKEYVMKFLAPGMWEKHKSELQRKMDTIVNPLRTVGHAVRQVPDGFRSLSSDVFKGEFSGSKESISSSDTGKVGAGLDLETYKLGDNIPLRIMLLLMDEVFELRHKNQWLRRQIVKILRQLIKATFGDRINRKIVEQVDFMTSAEQMAEYIKNLRDSFWPGGILAEPRPPRDQNTRMRTRVVCKAKMLGSIPDELRHMMGTETVKIGVGRIFDMFQHKSINKRLVYVILEGVIETLFPQNKFPELFRKLHSKSQRLKSKELDKGDNLKENAFRQKSVKS
ncbi:hypothetical protein ACJMK2_023289 [Sinanodonta woodiana]|uniref:Sorting nexin-13 n=1 Tax=Sinanodonta woodiana TaxID=1069815 RepID=A0ABD3T4N4_SINWO